MRWASQAGIGKHPEAYGFFLFQYEPSLNFMSPLQIKLDHYHELKFPEFIFTQNIPLPLGAGQRMGGGHRGTDGAGRIRLECERSFGSFSGSTSRADI